MNRRQFLKNVVGVVVMPLAGGILAEEWSSDWYVDLAHETVAPLNLARGENFREQILLLFPDAQMPLAKLLERLRHEDPAFPPFRVSSEE